MHYFIWFLLLPVRCYIYFCFCIKTQAVSICAGLGEMHPPHIQLKHLNPWSPVAGALWRKFRMCGQIRESMSLEADLQSAYSHST